MRWVPWNRPRSPVRHVASPNELADGRAHLEAISPLNHVEKIKVPMFVVQGQNDPRVPVTEAEQIVAALRANGQPVWYMNALNEGHGYRKKENRDIYGQAVVMFFREHLVGAE